jgi:cyclomaltodextrinase
MVTRYFTNVWPRAPSNSRLRRIRSRRRSKSVAANSRDIANDAYDNRIEKAWGTRRVNASLAAIFTLDGVSMIYNGQEVADTARHSIFGRLPIDWASGDTSTGRARQAFCKRLCSLRHAERVLTHGALIWLDNDQPNSVLSFLRRDADEDILSVVNLSERATPVRITFPEPTRRSCSTLLAEGALAESSDGGLLLNLEGFGYLVAKRK